MTPLADRCQKRDCGQAAVEFAIGFPIVLIALLAIAQVAVVVRDQLAVELAAREAVRAASVTTSTSSANSAGQNATAVDAISITISSDGAVVTATATRPIRALPLVGLAVAGRSVTATASMLIEPP